MRKSIHAILVLIVVMAASTVLADARYDARVDKEKDSKGNIVYKLTNTGDKNIRVLVQHKKTCSSTSTKREPTEREYWLTPQRSTHLRKVIANSDCRHTYRVVRAEYY